jgi:tRNA(His) 5'-end guanylyltransferase
VHDLDKYLIWRQAEAWGNHVNSYGYYTLRKEGLNERDATEKMHGMKASEIHEMVFACGINLNETPAWHRRGVLIVKEIYEKKGYNPKEGKEMTAPRTRVIQIWDLPAFSSKEGGELIEELIQSL